MSTDPTNNHEHQAATVIPFAVHEQEARRAGQDGYYWPFARERMRMSRHIRQRMADDMVAILSRSSRGRVIVTDDLLKLGWTALQIDTHREAAAALVDPAAAPAEQDPMVA